MSAPLRWVLDRLPLLHSGLRRLVLAVWRRDRSPVPSTTNATLAEPARVIAPPAIPIPQNARPPENDDSLALPFGYLPQTPVRPSPLAVVLHLFHLEMAPEFLRYLSNIRTACDVFVSTDTAEKRAVIERIFAQWPAGSVEVRIAPNRGRDVAPKLLLFRDVHRRYDIVLHLHSKQSDHASSLAHWRGYLLESLLGSPQIVASILDLFTRELHLEMVAAQHFEPVPHWIDWGVNFTRARRLAERMGRCLVIGQGIGFPLGFNVSGRGLRPSPSSCSTSIFSFDEFDDENHQVDGTLAHAIERMFFYACNHAGYAWIKVARQEFFKQTPCIHSIGNPATSPTLSQDKHSI